MKVSELFLILCDDGQLYFFNAAILSLRFDDAFSHCRATSCVPSQRTAAGALLFTNFSILPSFFSTLQNPSLCFSSASIRAISATSIILPKRYGIFRSTYHEGSSTRHGLVLHYIDGERLHIFMITALNATTGFSPITCNSSVSFFWAMFFCKRMERIFADNLFHHFKLPDDILIYQCRH